MTVVSWRSSAGRDRRGRTDGPLIARILGEGSVDGSKSIVVGRSLSVLNVVIVPAEGLVGLDACHEFLLCDLVDNDGQSTSRNQINSIMMLQVTVESHV